MCSINCNSHPCPYHQTTYKIYTPSDLSSPIFSPSLFIHIIISYMICYFHLVNNTFSAFILGQPQNVIVSKVTENEKTTATTTMTTTITNYWGFLPTYRRNSCHNLINNICRCKVLNHVVVVFCCVVVRRSLFASVVVVFKEQQQLKIITNLQGLTATKT